MAYAESLEISIPGGASIVKKLFQKTFFRGRRLQEPVSSKRSCEDMTMLGKDTRVSNVKAVLFDLAGTLHHYRREEVFRAVLREKRIEVGIDEVVHAYDVTDPIFAQLTAELPQEVMWTKCAP